MRIYTYGSGKRWNATNYDTNANVFDTKMQGRSTSKIKTNQALKGSIKKINNSTRVGFTLTVETCFINKKLNLHLCRANSLYFTLILLLLSKKLKGLRIRHL